MLDLATSCLLVGWLIHSLSPLNPDDVPRVHQVYYWIGATSSTDKQASAAINSVHLRNFLEADTTSQVRLL